MLKSIHELWACEENYLLNYLRDIHNISAEKIEAAMGSNLEAPAIFSVSSPNTVDIIIRGVLSRNGPSKWARFLGYGGTSYNDIISAANEVAQMEKVENVNLYMDTPGGAVAGVDETYAAIAELAKTKNVVAINQGMIASAGYWIATAANRIESTSPTNSAGSIGVIITQYIETEDYGYKEVVIVSRNAPNKAADASTEKGIAVLQAHANAIERVFLDRVAMGRGVEIETVIKKFGKGGVLISQDPDQDTDDALSVGMIDAVTSIDFKKGKTMTIPANVLGAIQPAVTQPAVTQPAVTQPVVTQPTVTNDASAQNLAVMQAANAKLEAQIEASAVAAKEMEQRQALAMTYIQSDKYPARIKAVANQAMAGAVTLDYLMGACAEYESMQAQTTTDAAAVDTNEAGPTRNAPNALNGVAPELITDANEDLAVAQILKGSL